MATTIARTVASGSTDVFTVPFDKLDRSHLIVKLNGVVTTDYSWVDDGNIKLGSVPTSGTIVERQRWTPDSPLVDFSPGNLDTNDLDTASKQPLYVAQEARSTGEDILLRGWFTNGVAEAGGKIVKGAEGDVPVFDADGNLSGSIKSSDVATAQEYGEAAIAANEAAQAAAQAIANAPQWSFASKAAAALFNPSAPPDFLSLTGWDSANDLGEARLYEYSATEPEGDDKFQIGSGAWYARAELPLSLPAIIQGQGPWKLTKFHHAAGMGIEAADTEALSRSLASGEKNLLIDPVEFKVAANTYELGSNVLMRGYGFASSIRCNDPLLASALLKPSTHSILENFAMRGPTDGATYTAGQKAIGGFSETNLPQGMVMRGLHLWNWGDCGLHITGDRNGEYTGNYIHNCGRMAARFTGGLGTRFNGNRLEDIGPGFGGNSPAINAYGVSFSHDGASTGYEKPTNIQCRGNYIRGVPSWEGIDCHSVDGFDVSHNIVLDTMIGIYLGPSSGSNNTNARRHLCSGNFIKTTAQYRRQGIIAIQSGSLVPDGNGDGLIINGNWIEGHGLNQALYDAAIGVTTGGAISVSYVDNPIVTNNIIKAWNFAAIHLLANINGGRVSDNELGSGVVTNGIGDFIRITSPDSISTVIGPNTMRRTSGSLTGINISGTGPGGVFGPRVHRQNMIGVPTPLAAGSWALMHEESQYELFGTTTNDLPSFAAGSGGQFSISVSEAAVGDDVSISASNSTAGLIVTGTVISTGTVRVTVFNASDAAIDMGSTRWTARVRKRGTRLS